MVVCLFISTLIVVALLGASIESDHSSALIAVALTGALGGFVSALRRFYNFDPTADPGPAFRLLGRSTGYLLIYSLIPPLIGMIGALVLYVIFAAALIDGTIFPHFAVVHDSSVEDKHTCLTHFQRFIYDWKPEQNVDYAKAFVWGFIAGFSERFVPDILTKLAGQADNSK